MGDGEMDEEESTMNAHPQRASSNTPCFIQVREHMHYGIF